MWTKEQAVAVAKAIRAKAEIPTPSFTNPQAGAIYDLLQSQNWGEHRKNITAIMEALVEEKIPTLDWKLPGLGAIVVPLTRSGGHNYPTNRPVMLISEDVAMTMDGGTGNHLPVSRKEVIRFATDEEIESFLESHHARIWMEQRLIVL